MNPATPVNWAAVAAIVAALAFATGLVGSAVVVLWKSSGMVTQMTAALIEIRGTITEMRHAMEDLKKIPLHEQRITTLEGIARHLAGQIASILLKLGMHSGELKAARTRAGSSPDLAREP